MSPRILALGLAALCVSVCTAELIPIEDFARPPTYSEVGLAPDGQTCAFLREVDGQNILFFADVATSKVHRITLGYAERLSAKREVAWYHWLGPKRVLVGVGVFGDLIEGTAAFDSNGSHWLAISGVVGYGRGIRLNYDPLWAWKAIFSYKDDAHVLMLDQREAVGSDRLYPHVVDVNTQTGTYERVVKNPGHVVGWLPDRQGTIRIGVERTKDKTTLIYRDDEKSPWRPLSELPTNLSNPPEPLGFSSDGKSIYLIAQNEKDFRAFYFCDLATGKIGEPLLELPGYDVEFLYSGPRAGPIWSDRKQAIVGFRYVTDGPRVKWFDADYEQNMAAINQALPGMVNLPMNISNNDQSMLILSFSDCEPGAYYIYTPAEGKMQTFARVCPWIKPEQMAEMHPIKYTARDGLEIKGYLTVPLGQKAMNLPLVVLPHGGPWIRDMWGYDPLVQMLANRGYAVLQMNYRGSAGYGADFSKKGRKEVGGAIQQDIEDATRWAIRKKIADPTRIAIMGASYGGYSALYALGQSPGLYCCGISIAGVTDWVSIYKNLDDPEYVFAREHWIKEIGDPEKDEEILKAISPVNFADKIVAPLLIIQGKEDKRVPQKQAKKMIAALENAGRKPESLFISEEGHSFRREKARIQEFKAIEAFLAKHLGPGATAEASSQTRNPVVTK